MNRDVRVIKLSDAKKDESVRKELCDIPAVYIYSDEVGHQAYWRPGGSGYCNRVAGIGVFTGLEAWNKTNHCGDDKYIEFEEAQTFSD